jgi:hypothetical protein
MEWPCPSARFRRFDFTAFAVCCGSLLIEREIPRQRRYARALTRNADRADDVAALAELIIIPAEMPDSSIHGMRIGYVFAYR